MITRLHVPLLDPEDVVRHLGKQEDHWKEGRSAHAVAQVWTKAKGFPKSIATVLASHPAFAFAELIDAFFERKVDLRSAGHPSQTDLLAVAGINDGLAIFAVEGKAGETFGDLTHQWLDQSSTKEMRLIGLCSTLGISTEEAMPLRYQLLHCAASAIYEAQRYRTKVAALLIHSFSDDKSGFQDFSGFLAALGAREVTPNTLVGPFSCEDVSLYAAWVQDKAPRGTEYLDKLRDYAVRLSQWCDRVRAFCDKKQSTS